MELSSPPEASFPMLEADHARAVTGPRWPCSLSTIRSSPSRLRSQTATTESWPPLARLEELTGDHSRARTLLLWVLRTVTSLLAMFQTRTVPSWLPVARRLGSTGDHAAHVSSSRCLRRGSSASQTGLPRRRCIRRFSWSSRWSRLAPSRRTAASLYMRSCVIGHTIISACRIDVRGIVGFEGRSAFAGTSDFPRCAGKKTSWRGRGGLSAQQGT